MIQAIIVVVSTILGFYSGCSVFLLIIKPLRQIINKEMIKASFPESTTETFLSRTNETSKKLFSQIKYYALLFLFNIIVLKYGSLVGFSVGFGVAAALFSFFLLFFFSI